MNISVFGLGYVGAVSVACLARDGHRVIGVDIDEHKLEMVAAGASPVVEAGMGELMHEAVASGRLSVTAQAAAAVAGSDLSFVCVGTPSAENGSHDINALRRVASEIGSALRHKRGRHCVIVRSTVAPGTIDREIRPAIEAASGRRDGEGFDLGFQPEFLREGSSIADYDDPPMIVLGATNPALLNTLEAVFGIDAARVHLTSISAAEMMKFCCNGFHALKITFANEVARLCAATQVDPFEVMRVLCEDRQLNISAAYLRPGFAFGGSCLPKDLRATSYLARAHDVATPMLDSILPSNRVHLDEALRMVLDDRPRRVALLGLSFKSGTDDLRESPLVALAEGVLGKGIPLAIFDPFVSTSRLIGANRRYIDEHLPHLGRLLSSDIDAVVAGSDRVVLGTVHAGVIDALARLLEPEQHLIDLVGLPADLSLPCNVQGLCW